MGTLSRAGRHNILHKILSTFPAGINYAFAYGSAVFKQQNNIDSKNMIDLIFVVDDPSEWHAANLHQNLHHYSMLRHCGSDSIASIQDNIGAGVYYNTRVECQNMVCCLML
ncbi:phosphatidate cytidylyltransferase, mitochondrial-like, partial [Anneissia japonica]|uniref:phosphatidate cytidylyltransferase, mitochondrial-like n=1 Tax=Anneissia japonica TaxID=1529436 RepID=UPI001425AC34